MNPRTPKMATVGFTPHAKTLGEPLRRRRVTALPTRSLSEFCRCRVRLAVLLVAAFSAATTWPPIVWAGVPSPADSGPAGGERPFVIVALSSVDTLRERIGLVARATDDSDCAALLFERVTGGLGALLMLDGFDSSRPIGWLTYPQFARVPSQRSPLEPVGQSATGFAVPERFDYEGIEQFLMDEPVIFFPVRDAERLVKALAAITDGQFLRDPERPGFFRDGKGVRQPVRLVGKYLFFCNDGIVDRDFPDMDRLLRPLLTNRDVVVSVQASGIAPAVRRAIGDAVLFAAAAARQRRDDESELDFRWRTAYGVLRRELMELLILHIDELSVGMRLDPVRLQATFDVDVVGREGGKFAKFCNEFRTRRGLLDGLAREEGPLSLALACSFSPRLAKSVLAALRTKPQFGVDWCASDDSVAALATVFGALADTLETGRIDLMATTTANADDDASALLGLRIAGSRRFVDAVHHLLEQHRQYFETSVVVTAGSDGEPEVRAEKRPYLLAAESIQEWPTHRVPAAVVHELLGGRVNDSTAPLPKEGALWITATPQSLWIAWSKDETKDTAPKALEDAVRSLVQPVGTAASAPRSTVPFRLTLHLDDRPSGQPHGLSDKEGRSRSLRPETTRPNDQTVQNAPALDTSDNRTGTLRCEVFPSSRGMRMVVKLEEAYLGWYGQLLLGSAEEQETGSDSPSH